MAMYPGVVNTFKLGKTELKKKLKPIVSIVEYESGRKSFVFSIDGKVISLSAIPEAASTAVLTKLNIDSMMSSYNRKAVEALEVQGSCTMTGDPNSGQANIECDVTTTKDKLKHLINFEVTGKAFEDSIVKSK